MSKDNKGTQTIKLSQEILDVLEKSVISNFHILRIPTISDKLYDELVWAVNSIGGTWSERYKGFIFATDPKDILEDLLEDGEYELDSEAVWRESVQFYPTPLSVVSEIIALAELKAGDRVLEPSAGHGNILSLLPAYVSAIAVEYDPNNYSVLLEKQKQGQFAVEDLKISQGDFLATTGLLYNKVIMNPPFSKFQDLKHIVHALDMLEEGGTLVAVMGENSLIRSQYNEEANGYMNVIRSYKHEILYLRECSFVESGTTVNTIVVKVVKVRN